MVAERIFFFFSFFVSVSLSFLSPQKNKIQELDGILEVT